MRTEIDDLKIGRIRALIMESVEVAVSRDYGADNTPSSEDHLTKLAEANIFVPVLNVANNLEYGTNKALCEAKSFELLILFFRHVRIQNKRKIIKHTICKSSASNKGCG